MKLARSNAIISVLADVDLTGQEGRFVRISNAASVCLMDAALDTPLGLLLTGGKVNERVDIALSAGGLAGTVRVKLAQAAGFGSDLQLTADGRVEPYDNEFPRMLVAVALESGGVNELIEAVLRTPTYTPAVA